MKRPRRKIQLQPLDYMTEVLAVAGLIMLVILPAAYWSDLPASIPRHYNAAGEPDVYGSKSIIWVLAAIAFALYAGLTILNRFPHIFNYPVRVTDENAQRLYILGTRTIRIVKTIMIIVFAFISYHSISIALGHGNTLGRSFIPLIIAFMFLSLGYMVFRMIKSR